MKLRIDEAEIHVSTDAEKLLLRHAKAMAADLGRSVSVAEAASAILEGALLDGE